MKRLLFYLLHFRAMIFILDYTKDTALVVAIFNNFSMTFAIQIDESKKFIP